MDEMMNDLCTIESQSVAASAAIKESQRKLEVPIMPTFAAFYLIL